MLGNRHSLSEEVRESRAYRAALFDAAADEMREIAHRTRRQEAQTGYENPSFLEEAARGEMPLSEVPGPGSESEDPVLVEATPYPESPYRHAHVIRIYRDARAEKGDDDLYHAACFRGRAGSGDLIVGVTASSRFLASRKIQRVAAPYTRKRHPGSVSSAA